jgi:hypothetical protein
MYIYIYEYAYMFRNKHEKSANIPTYLYSGCCGLAMTHHTEGSYVEGFVPRW